MRRKGRVTIKHIICEAPEQKANSNVLAIYKKLRRSAMPIVGPQGPKASQKKRPSNRTRFANFEGTL